MEFILKECPFCGGQATFGTVRYSEQHVNEQGWNQSELFFVSCVICGSNNKGIVGKQSKTTAADHWNKRTPDLTAEVDRLKAEKAELVGALQYLEKVLLLIERTDCLPVPSILRNNIECVQQLLQKVQP